MKLRVNLKTTVIMDSLALLFFDMGGDHVMRDRAGGHPTPAGSTPPELKETSTTSALG